MEFLFLNESAGFADDSSAYKSMVTFAESQGVDISEDANKSLTEVMLEAEEGFHEAEMTAMREEFALYQESIQEGGEVLQEGFLQKVGSKLKSWWEAIKKFLIKLWGKIVHAFWAAVQWARKTIQAAIQKLHGANSIFVPKSLEEVCKFGAQKVPEIVREMDSAISDVTSAIQTKTKDGKSYEIKVKSLNNALSNIRTEFDNLKVKVKADAGGKKYSGTKQMNSKGNLSSVKSDEKGEMKQVPFSVWKKWMDDSLKTFENTKKAADKNQKDYQKVISTLDKNIETYYKQGNEDEVASTRKAANFARVVASVSSKVNSALIGINRWIMGALFHYSSYKSSKAAKSIEV